MYNSTYQQKINSRLGSYKIKDAGFAQRFGANISDISEIFQHIYGRHPQAQVLFDALLDQICTAHLDRKAELKKRDAEK
ncbi:MAG: hypothetical protein ACKOXH_01675, partial [Aquirufa sp.]